MNPYSPVKEVPSGGPGIALDESNGLEYDHPQKMDQGNVEGFFTECNRCVNRSIIVGHQGNPFYINNMCLLPNSGKHQGKDAFIASRKDAGFPGIMEKM